MKLSRLLGLGLGASVAATTTCDSPIDKGGPLGYTTTYLPLFVNLSPEQQQLSLKRLSNIIQSGAIEKVLQPYARPGGAFQPATILAALPSETSPSTLDDSDIQNIIGKAAITDPNIVPVVFTSGSTITLPVQGSSCVDFYGYHSEMQHQNQSYIVFPDLGDCSQTAVPLEELSTMVMSHEMVENRSNKFCNSAPAWIIPNAASGVNEIADPGTGYGYPVTVNGRSIEIQDVLDRSGSYIEPSHTPAYCTPPPPKLSAGAIAGIALGALATAGLAAYCCIRNLVCDDRGYARTDKQKDEESMLDPLVANDGTRILRAT